MSSVRPGGTRRPVARVEPVVLPASAQVRLRRLVPGGSYKEEGSQLLVPLPEGGDAADAVRALLEELLPPTDAGVAGDTL